MVEIAASLAIAGISIDLGRTLWMAISKRREENRNLDIFRVLIKFKDLKPNSFVETLINLYIPHVIENNKNEIKIKRYIAKFCITIPKVIYDACYDDIFPKLNTIKKELITKLIEFEKMKIEDLKQKFSSDTEKIRKSIRYAEQKDLQNIKTDLETYHSIHPDEFPSASWSGVATTHDYVKKVNEVKENFYDSSGMKLDYNIYDHQYIDNYVSGAIGEYITPPYVINFPYVETTEFPYLKTIEPYFSYPSSKDKQYKQREEDSDQNSE